MVLLLHKERLKCTSIRAKEHVKFYWFMLDEIIRTWRVPNAFSLETQTWQHLKFVASVHTWHNYQNCTLWMLLQRQKLVPRDCISSPQHCITWITGHKHKKLKDKSYNFTHLYFEDNKKPWVRFSCTKITNNPFCISIPCFDPPISSAY